MSIQRLTSGHIKDLTTPRYVWKIKDYKKYIIDTHSNPIVAEEYLGDDLSGDVEQMNTEYHNDIAWFLGFNLKIGLEMQRINRSAW